MEKKIQIHCNSASTALREKVSTYIFEKFLEKFLNIVKEQKDKIFSIFKKIKQGNGISEDEYTMFSLFLDHKDAEKYLWECRDEFFNIPERKKETVSYTSLRSELLLRLINSRAIDILQREKYRTPIIEIEGKSFLWVIENGKQVYFEIIDRISGYISCKNLRSWKTVIYYETSLIQIYSDMGNLSISEWYFPDTLLVNWKILVHKKWAITIEAQDVWYFEDKFFYYIIDVASQNIHRIDKKTHKYDIEGTSNYIFRAFSGKYIVWENRNRRGEFYLFELTGTLKIFKEISDYRQEKGQLIIANNNGIEGQV